MENIQHIHNISSTRAQHGHPTIGLLLPGIEYANEERVWLGALDASKSYDVNLISVIGGHLKAPDGFQAQANVLYDLIGPKRLDGILIFSSTVGWYLDQEGLAAFCGRYHPLPRVSMDAVVTGIPSVIKDNYTGIRDAMIHLIDVHGYRRIAFLRGPESHQGLQERYRAYCDTLAAYGLPVDPTLISPPQQGWDQAAAVSLMEGFIQEWQLRPGQDFEAIVAATDNLARNAIKVLQARGLRVPQDVAVTGFDDEQESRVITPPLTTVPFPAYEMGQRGVDIFLSLWRGEDVPAEVVIPAKLVVRQSCGCQSPVVLQADAEAQHWHGKPSASPVSCEAALTMQRDAIVAEIVDTIGAADQEPVRGQTERLIDAFITEVQQASPGAFLAALEDILQQVAAAGTDVTAWQNVISVLRRQMLPVLRNDVLFARAENLWGKARVLIGETAQRTQAYQIVQAEQRAQVLRELGAALITTFEVQGLMDILAAGLPRLAMPGCYLAVYDNPKTPTEWAKLLLVYDRQGRREVGDPGDRFPSAHLIPDEFFPQERCFSLVLMPLYFRAQQIGFVLFEGGLREGKVYEALRGQSSSALQGALLVQSVQEHAAEITRQKYVLDTFMANVPDSIYFKDSNSRFIQANRALANLFGVHAPDELVGKSDFDFFAADQARPKYEQEQEILRTGQPLVNLEEPDAGGRWALTTKMPLRDEHGAIIGTFGISRDITPLKQAQLEVAAAYEEIKILNYQLKDENLQMHAEMDVARRIQTALLPHMVRHLHPDFEIAAVMLPAEEVGGDYYDITLDQEGMLWFGIGDVSGHGVTPGLIMMMAQTVHTTITTNYQASAREIVCMINKVLFKNVRGRLEEDHFMTFTTLKYLGDGRFQHAGSHLALIVYRQRTQTCALIDTTGTWLNFIPDIAEVTQNAEFMLEIGDLLVLYTDGLTEAFSPQDEILDIHRFVDIVRRHAENEVEACRDAVIADVMTWCQGKQHDDMSLVVARRVK